MNDTATAHPTRSLGVNVGIGIVMAILVLVTAALYTFAANRWLPYAPTTVDVYEVAPHVDLGLPKGEVCPTQEVITRTGFNVEPPSSGSVVDFSVVSEWVNADDPTRRIPLENARFPFDGVYGYHDVISPVVRYAPSEPGRWYLETALTTHGTQALHEAHDTVEGIVSNTLTVVPYRNPPCEALDGA